METDTGHIGSHLLYQLSVGRGKKISESEASMVYTASSETANVWIEIHKNKRKTGGTVPRMMGFSRSLKEERKQTKEGRTGDRSEERREETGEGRKTEGDTKAKLLI